MSTRRMPTLLSEKLWGKSKEYTLKKESELSSEGETAIQWWGVLIFTEGWLLGTGPEVESGDSYTISHQFPPCLCIAFMLLFAGRDVSQGQGLMMKVKDRDWVPHKCLFCISKVHGISCIPTAQGQGHYLPCPFFLFLFWY